MSCRRKVKTFEVVEIKLDDITKSDLISVEEKVCNILSQKLEKLNVLTKEMSIYAYKDFLVINDRYNICKDLVEVAEAFNFEIKRINCSLKGNSYLVTDGLMVFLKQLGVSYEFGKNIANQSVTEEIKELIEREPRTEVSEGMLEILDNIRQNGSYTFTKRRTITTSYYDNRIEGKKEGKWNIDESGIQGTIKAFANQCNNIVSRANADMVNGTSNLIRSRAKSMGYSVQEVKKGKEVQLVLVRLQ